MCKYKADFFFFLGGERQRAPGFGPPQNGGLRIVKFFFTLQFKTHYNKNYHFYTVKITIFE